MVCAKHTILSGKSNHKSKKKYLFFFDATNIQQRGKLIFAIFIWTIIVVYSAKIIALI